MVSNPFSEGVSVEIGGDSSPLQNELDGAITKLGNFRTQVGLAGAALATAAAVGFAKATDKAREWEDVMADVEKVTDPATVEELDGRLQDLGTSIPIPTENLAILAEQAGKFGAESPEEIEKFVESVGKIQTATDLSAEEAGKRFAKIAGAVGMPLTEIDKLGNGVNVLADSMKTDASEITDTANRTANVLSQQLGLGEDAVLALSASMNEVSPSSEKAAGGLQRAAEALMIPKKVEDLANALGMTPEEFRNLRDENPEQLMNMVSDSMADGDETARDLSEALGTRATRAFSKLGEQQQRTEEAQGKVNEQFGEGTSLQEEMEIRTNAFSGQVQLLKNQLGNLGRSIGGVVLPHLSTLLGHVTDAVSVFSELNQRTSGMAGTVSLLVVGITGAVAAIGALGSALAASSVATAAITGAVGALTTVIGALSAPVLAAAGAVAALGLAWKTNFGGIRDITYRTLNQIRRLFRMHFGEYTDEVNRAMQLIQQTIQTTLGVVGKLWSAHGSKVKAIVRTVFDGIGVIVVNFMDGLFGTIKAGLQLLTGDWRGAWETMSGVVDRNLSRITGFITRWGIVGKIRSVLSGVKTAMGNAFTSAKEAALQPMRTLEQRVNSILDAIVGRIETVMSRVEDAKSAASDVGGGAKEKAGGMVDRGMDMIGLDTGGYIKSDGIAKLHAGERVIPEKDVERGGLSGGTTVNIENINASGRREGKEAGRALNQELRSAGFRS